MRHAPGALPPSRCERALAVSGRQAARRSRQDAARQHAMCSAAWSFCSVSVTSMYKLRCSASARLEHSTWHYNAQNRTHTVACPKCTGEAPMDGVRSGASLPARQAISGARATGGCARLSAPGVCARAGAVGRAELQHQVALLYRRSSLNIGRSGANVHAACNVRHAGMQHVAPIYPAACLGTRRRHIVGCCTPHHPLPSRCAAE